MKTNFSQSRLLLIALVCFVFGAFTAHYWTLRDITRSDVLAAGNIAGLEFSTSEADSMLEGLQGLRKTYEDMRAIPLPNEVLPSLVFNPLPPGFQIPPSRGPVRFADPGFVKMPANKTDLAWYSVPELGELLRTRQITSVELTRFFLDRLRQYDKELHCVITYTEERALQHARQADAEIQAGHYRGPLHGIPYGAKDLLAVAGYPTTWGAMPYKDQQLDIDAEVIRKLDAAGAVLVAKLSMGALAWGDVWFRGMTRNPWDTLRGSSGSSAGSAAAVSAGLVPFAIGTETLGSIVSPSTVCGTTGLRPTFGRVSRSGAMALSWTMDKIGPITRSAEDCAIVFNAIQGPDSMDPALIAAPFDYNAYRDLKSLRVGFVKNAFEGNYPFKKADSLALETLKKMGIDLIPIELPQIPDLTFLLSVEGAAAFDEMTRSNKDDLLVRQVRNAWPNVFRQSRLVPAVEYLQANRIRTQVIAHMQQIMQKVDVYVAPSWASPSLRITNLTGHPAVVVPNGFRDGRPTSITFTGQLFGEADILRLAKAFQDASDFHQQHPGWLQ